MQIHDDVRFIVMLHNIELVQTVTTVTSFTPCCDARSPFDLSCKVLLYFIRLSVKIKSILELIKCRLVLLFTWESRE